MIDEFCQISLLNRLLSCLEPLSLNRPPYFKGTLCYCDTFCNRTGNSDCCPDYFTHCLGLQSGLDQDDRALKRDREGKDNGEDDDGFQYAEGKPEEKIFPGDLECPQGVVNPDGDSRCFVDGKSYTTRDRVKRNCNICQCQASLSNPRCMELLCETESCLMDENIANEINRGDYGWTAATNYSSFWGRTLEDGLRGKLGTFKPADSVSRDVRAMKAVHFDYSPDDIPDAFDARTKWPGKIHGVRDQGWCGASWAFSTTTVAADRFAIEGESAEEMSAQSLISCNTQGQSGCRGGHVDRAWNYLRRFGTVPESCYPFASENGYGDSSANEVEASDPAGSCLIPRSHQPAMARTLGGRCPQMIGRRRLFRAQPAYRVGRADTQEQPRRKEMDVMFEIMNRGPVQALMEVKSDLFLYRSGVYRQTNLANDNAEGNFHSVKIIGWGEDNDGRPYWLCMNSWGKDWGEEGLFRIARGDNECQIEDFVVGVWAQTEEYARKMVQRRRRRLREQQQERRRRHHRRNSNQHRHGHGGSQQNRKNRGGEQHFQLG